MCLAARLFALGVFLLTLTCGPKAWTSPNPVLAPVEKIVLTESIPFLERSEWEKLKTAISKGRVESVTLKQAGEETQVIDIYSDVLRVDFSHFAQAVADGFAAVVVAQAYYFTADLDYAAISERTDEQKVTLPRRLRAAGQQYARQVKEHATPKRSVTISAPKRDTQAEAQDREIQKVLAEADRVLAHPTPLYVPRSQRPDYEALTKDVVAPYEAAAELVRAKGEIKRARGEASCICHGTCLFYKGVATETAREYDFAVDAEDYTRAGCMAKMRRDCRGHGGVGQGVWGFNVVETDFTPGCR